MAQHLWRVTGECLFHACLVEVECRAMRFVGGMKQVMPFLPVGGPLQSNSFGFGASMSPGFAILVSPAFGWFGSR